jgi:hypothetical protein
MTQPVSKLPSWMPSFVGRSARRLLGPELRGRENSAVAEAGRLVTRRSRALPTFLVIGAQKAGTTALFLYLSGHPSVRPPIEKEIGYFSTLYGNGLSWYRAHFPLLPRAWFERARGGAFATGEATPYYLFHPRAPERVAETLPGAKLIVLLRNPVDRAYSHHQHRLRLGIEHLPFDAALAAEDERLAGQRERMLAEDGYESRAFNEFSYKARGRYAEQLAAWRMHFPRDQMLILVSEELFSAPDQHFLRVLDFLDLPHWLPDNFRPWNEGYYEEMSGDLRRSLVEYFRPHNERLRHEFEVDTKWDR